MSTKLLVYLPGEIHTILPLGFDHDLTGIDSQGNASLFARHLPELYAAIQRQAGSSQTVSEEELSTIYGARSCVVEHYEPETLTIGIDTDNIVSGIGQLGLNSLPMYYKIWACDQLRKAAEISDGLRYDLVIRMRPDYMILGKLPDDLISDPRGLTVLQSPFYEAAGITGSTFDAFAIGTSAAMSVYSSVWPCLPCYFDERMFPGWPLAARGPESILHRHLSHIGVANNTFTPDFPFFRHSLGIDIDTVLPILIGDVAGKPHMAELEGKLRSMQVDRARSQSAT